MRSRARQLLPLAVLRRDAPAPRHPARASSRPRFQLLDDRRHGPVLPVERERLPRGRKNGKRPPCLRMTAFPSPSAQPTTPPKPAARRTAAPERRSGGIGERAYFGRSTLSMTWTTPFGLHHVGLRHRGCVAGLVEHDEIAVLAWRA